MRFDSLILEQPVEEPPNSMEGSVIPVRPVVITVRVVAIRITVAISVRIYDPITVSSPGITIYVIVSPIIAAVIGLLHLIRVIIHLLRVVIPLRLGWNDGRHHRRKHKGANQ
jgi:hypothetical protein